MVVYQYDPRHLHRPAFVRPGSINSQHHFLYMVHPEHWPVDSLPDEGLVAKRQNFNKRGLERVSAAMIRDDKPGPIDFPEDKIIMPAYISCFSREIPFAYNEIILW